jgi:hypothetical protein
VAKQKLKAPFPAFGGKSAVASLVWDRLGDPANFIEPFFNSGAVLLLRPHEPKIETVNDIDCYIANFWRATSQAPDEVARHADWPVSECDLHSRHRWLVLSDDAAAFRQRMRTDPDYFDARVAGWWVWGACAWIGSGWCTDPDRPVNGPAGGSGDRSVILGGGEGQQGHGIHAKGWALAKKVPAGQRPLTGVHAKRPRAHRESGSGKGGILPGVHGDLGQQVPLIGDSGRGGHHGPDELMQQLPMLTGDSGASGRGVHARGLSDTHRPQLADAYSRGRGVNGNDAAGTCEQRLTWLTDWFRCLRDRFRTVRVCCGDWLRVCDSESVTTRLGLTGIFFDPPYGKAAGRNMSLYAHDSGTVAADVRAYCLERGADPSMRIALCGYVGEGHEVLERNGWTVEAWKANGGYGNVGKKGDPKGNGNARKERIWFSPFCLKAPDLFADLED